MLQQSIEQDSKKAWQRFELYRIQLAEIEQQLEQAAANIARAPEDEQLMDLLKSCAILISSVKINGKNIFHCWKTLNGLSNSNWIVSVNAKTA